MNLRAEHFNASPFSFFAVAYSLRFRRKIAGDRWSPLRYEGGLYYKTRVTDCFRNEKIKKQNEIVTAENI